MEELMPKDLLPMISNVGTVNPIKGPATYQGQGCLIHSKKFILKFITVTKATKVVNFKCTE
jgi:hypothetical protein